MSYQLPLLHLPPRITILTGGLAKLQVRDRGPAGHASSQRRHPGRSDARCAASSCPRLLRRFTQSLTCPLATVS
jgi:hypothetical protein